MVVHVAGLAHFLHGRIPVAVVRVAGFELLARVEVRTWIAAPAVERLSGPFRHGLVGVVALVVEDVVHGQFASDNQLFQVGRTILVIAGLGVPNGECDLDGRDLPEVQIGAHVRCRPGLRHAAVLGVARERLGEISVQPRPSARRPTLEAADRAHAVVNPERAEGARHVGEIDVALDMHIGCTMAKGSRLQRDDVLLPHAIQLGSERARADLVLGRGGLDRDDHIALDLDDAARSPAAQAYPPRLLQLEIAPVADDERSLAGELKRDRVGRTAADHKSHPSFAEVSLDLGKALQHEGVVACVGLGVSVHQPETDQNRQVSCVPFINGQLQRRVEARPLRLLHPVEHVATAALRLSLVEDADARGWDGHQKPLSASEPRYTTIMGRLETLYGVRTRERWRISSCRIGMASIAAASSGPLIGRSELNFAPPSLPTSTARKASWPTRRRARSAFASGDPARAWTRTRSRSCAPPFKRSNWRFCSITSGLSGSAASTTSTRACHR